MQTARLVQSEPRETRRIHKRFNYDAQCTIESGNRRLNARSRDISEGGLSLELRGLGRLEIGSEVAVHLEGCPPIDAIVRWNKDRVVGLQFVMPVGFYPSVARLLKRIEAAASLPRSTGSTTSPFNRADPVWLRPEEEAEDDQ